MPSPRSRCSSYGTASRRAPERRPIASVWVFLARLETLPFDDDDARAAGAVRAALEHAGTPIGAYDILLAGQAVRRGLILVTANVAEFARVNGLRWQNWAE